MEWILITNKKEININYLIPNKSPDWLRIIFRIIIDYEGATLNQLFEMSNLEISSLKENLLHLKNEKVIYTNKGRYYITKNPYFPIWADYFERLDDKANVFRSSWLFGSPCEDWWPGENSPDSKLIYYIGPYKDKYLSLYRNLIKPTIEKLGFECYTAIEQKGSQEFLRKKILPSLLNARYVLCDLSEKNVNVHYELGWLNAFGTPFYAFTSNKKRASDVHHLTIDSYEFTEDGLKRLQKDIVDSLTKENLVPSSLDLLSLKINYSQIIDVANKNTSSSSKNAS